MGPGCVPDLDLEPFIMDRMRFTTSEQPREVDIACCRAREILSLQADHVWDVAEAAALKNVWSDIFAANS